MFSADLKIVGFKTGLMGECSRVILIDTAGRRAMAKVRGEQLREHFALAPSRYVGRTVRIVHQGLTPDGKYRHPMFDVLLDPERDEP